jgi:hypothetical protein
MKAKIEITRGGYGFGHDWCLVVSTEKKQQRYYLGQDSKFCNRVLGMEPSEVVFRIGTREIDSGTRGNKVLARFICDRLGINGRNINKIKPWELCGQ